MPWRQDSVDRWVPRSAYALAFALVLASCERTVEGSDESPPARASASATPSARARAETSPEVEFVTAPHGASLFWVERGEVSSSILELGLDRNGDPMSTPQRRLQLEASVSDLSATWAGGTLYLAWVQQGASEASVWRYSSATGEQLRLAEAWVAPPRARGNLSLVSRGDHALLMARGPAHACTEDPSGTCHGFDLHHLRGAEVQSSGVPLDVPVPCESGSAHAFSLGSRWHYAVCTRQADQSLTTVFNITPKPEYAEAYSVLEGCRPLGFTHWAGGAWIVGDCPNGKRAVSLARQGADPIALEPARLRCSSDRMLLQAGSLQLRLEEPRERTHLLLDRADSSVRSLWTGRVHLTATSERGQLVLSRQQCSDGGLQQERLPPIAAGLVDATPAASPD